MKQRGVGLSGICRQLFVTYASSFIMDHVGRCRLQNTSSDSRRDQKKEWIAKKRKMDKVASELASPTLYFSSDDEMDPDKATTGGQCPVEVMQHYCGISITTPIVHG